MEGAATRGYLEFGRSLRPATIAPDVGAYAYTFAEAMTTLYEVRGLQ